MAANWAVSRRARAGRGWRGRGSGNVLFRGRGRRRMEDRKRRDDLDAHDGQNRNHVHRRNRRGAVRSKRDLRWHRRVVHSRKYFLWRRDVQVRGWRKDVVTDRAGGYATHREDRGASAESGHRVRGGTGTRVWTE